MTDANTEITAVVQTPGTIEATTAKHPQEFMSLDSALTIWDTEIDNLHDAKTTGRPLGIRTGLPSVDRELLGGMRPGLHILNAAPSAGKSALALQIATDCEAPAIYVSAEMGPFPIIQRLTARLTRTPAHDLITCQYPPEALKAKAREAIAQAPLFYLLNAMRGPVPVFPHPDTKDRPNLYDLGKELKERHQSNLLLIVIDAVHTWRCGAESVEYDTLALKLAHLQDLADQLQCAVLGIAQQNRQNEGKDTLSASAGHRDFEYRPETQWSLTYDASEKKKKTKMETLTFTKNRPYIQWGEVELEFDGALQTFRDPNAGRFRNA